MHLNEQGSDIYQPAFRTNSERLAHDNALTRVQRRKISVDIPQVDGAPCR